MKTFLCILSLLASASLMAQQDPQDLQDYKNRVDSALNYSLRNNAPYTIRIPNNFTGPVNTWRLNGDFDKIHPEALVINKTSRGTIYSLAPDNMAVLVPDPQKLEKMPGSNQYFVLPPKSNMPNPLYPQIKPKRRKE